MRECSRIFNENLFIWSTYMCTWCTVLQLDSVLGWSRVTYDHFWTTYTTKLLKPVLNSQSLVDLGKVTFNWNFFFLCFVFFFEDPCNVPWYWFCYLLRFTFPLVLALFICKIKNIFPQQPKWLDTPRDHFWASHLKPNHGANAVSDPPTTSWRTKN